MGLGPGLGLGLGGPGLRAEVRPLGRVLVASAWRLDPDVHVLEAAGTTEPHVGAEEGAVDGGAVTW